MAIFTTGAIVGSISGTVGDIVFVAGGKSNVVRPRPTVRRKNSPALSTARARMQLTRNAWRDMTDPQRAAWETLAITMPTTNALSVTSPTSGFRLFVRFNLERRNTTDTLELQAPTQGIGGPPRTFSVVFSAAGDFTILANPPTGFGAAIYFMYGWPFWTNRHTTEPCRIVFLKRQAAAGLTIDIRSVWEARFGTMVEGQRFCLGLATLTGSSFRSEILIIRGEVTA